MLCAPETSTPATFGRLTAARREISLDALASALSVCPQATQTNFARLFRFRLSTHPHSPQVREVFLASTNWTGTPARLALYRINSCNWPNDQLCRLRRCFFLVLTRIYAAISRFGNQLVLRASIAFWAFCRFMIIRGSTASSSLSTSISRDTFQV
jgi:hypothetical protein